MAKPTYGNVIGFYIEPGARPTWTGEVLDPKTGELVKEPSMTKQSFKDECDINNIVRRFEATQSWDHVSDKLKQGYFDDLPSGLDLHMAYNILQQSEEAFMALPAAVRAQFENDPVKFVDAFNNPTEEQQAKFIELGLAVDNRPKDTPPTRVEVVNPTPPKPAEP